MDEAAATRRVACEAVDDVKPVAFRTRIEAHIDSASMVPGVLTMLCAEAMQDAAGSVPTADSLGDPVAKRAAGVQLIYEGLRLTRRLAQDEPWDQDEAEAGDLDIIAADVLVARGFNLLARTEAADQAVETVRAFGRDQTVRRTTEDSTLDTNLEADVLELAAVAGATPGETGVTPSLSEFALDLATRSTADAGFENAETFFPEGVTDRLRTIVTDTAGSDGVRSSVDD
jgi:hypothetical protein